jgi:shikimate dehydrogenase
MPPPIILCGSVSRLASPLGRSMHEAGYQALGLPFTYVPFEVRDLPGAITGMRALGIRGLGVSQPFKQEVLPLADALDPVAERIGALNTIVNEGGRLVGHNTDWIGAMRALQEVTEQVSAEGQPRGSRPLSAARVLLVGAGGAARAIAFGLRERGAQTTIANRDEDKADRLAAAVGAHPAPFDEVRRAADYDIIVNATTLGQSDVGPESPIPENAIRAGQIVMDIVYKPLETRLVHVARARGAVVLHGGRMLLHQAAAQFELYTGCPAPLGPMQAALHRAMGEAVG